MTAKIIKALGVSAALGVAAMPLTTFAANPTAEGDVTVTINPAISMTLDSTNATATLDPNTVKSSNFYTTATVSTNATKGYTLSVIDKNADSALFLNGDTGATQKISAAAGQPTAATATWAVKDSNNAWVAMPDSEDTALIIKNSGAQTTPVSNEATNIEYAVSSGNSTIVSGTYKTTVVVTATVNNN